MASSATLVTSTPIHRVMRPSLEVRRFGFWFLAGAAPDVRGHVSKRASPGKGTQSAFGGGAPGGRRGNRPESAQSGQSIVALNRCAVGSTRIGRTDSHACA